MKFSLLLAFVLVSQLAKPAICAATVKSKLSCAMGISSKTYGQAPEALAQLLEPYWGSNYEIKDYVIVKLYTRENGDGEALILDDELGLHKSSFNFNRPTKVITHGYLNSGNSPSCKLMKDAFLSKGDYNVIVFDWWRMQSWLGWVPRSYGTAVKYVPEVSNFVTSMLVFLENNGLDLKTTTLIGHSLGAHVMGTASRRMKNKVNYIVGLDPALPAYETAEPGTRISTEDAATVEIIHTNEGHCGFSSKIGHFDFYPNGGSKQPGCLTNQCAHARAYEYYAESISSVEGFFGHKCEDFDEVKGGNCTGDLAKMGGLKGWHTRLQRSADDNSGGMYHVGTRNSAPYAMGK